MPQSKETKELVLRQLDEYRISNDLSWPKLAAYITEHLRTVAPNLVRRPIGSNTLLMACRRRAVGDRTLRKIETFLDMVKANAS